MNRAHLDWPFFDDSHRKLAVGVGQWAGPGLAGLDHHDVDASCRALVRQLGDAGWLRYCVPAEFGGALPQLDSRALCILRETLAFHDGLADFAFALQGLGSGAITLAGNPGQKARYLPRVAQGEAIAAFALSEADAGSDVAAMQTAARADGDDYVLDGEKTWISNGGIADFYVVFARTTPLAETRTTPLAAMGAKPLAATGATPPTAMHTTPPAGSRKPTDGISAFIVDAAAPGCSIRERIAVIAPHPLATLRFDGCRVSRAQMLGAEGEGFKIAMRTLDIFRASVAAAALGFARRALAEALAHAQTRLLFGQPLGNLQLTQARLADMATAIDAAALLTYRAAWLRDVKGVRTTSEAAMAKMTATESAQQVIDAAVQMFGGRGVKSGEIVERLYREVRALRIYEGATEVQKLIIARELLASHAPER